MEGILNKAIQAVQDSEIAFSKYITANDVGATGGHQAGFHIHKNAWPLFFDRPGEKGSNRDKFITIRWQDDFETDSRFIYYGIGTRNEYRLTRFGRGFSYLGDDNIGDLLILAKRGENFYDAYVLHHDEDIENFFAAVNMSSTDTNGIIPKQLVQTAEEILLECFRVFIRAQQVEFPLSVNLSARARHCYNNAYGIDARHIMANPDSDLLKWIEAEFQLFKEFENDRYATRIRTPFASVEELVEAANTILNRRKSRAGKSLEHHLSEMFSTFDVAYQTQVVTEGNKKPDFVFPGSEAYHNPRFDADKLIVMAAKTTCKDRWRQILNEADRVRTKHLFTLQQGISANQLSEMYEYNVCLVVPKPYITSFPQEYRGRILSLGDFIGQVRANQI
nr:MAG TPA: EcoRII C terminal [Caudoviricetes sp.]